MNKYHRYMRADFFCKKITKEYDLFESKEEKIFYNPFCSKRDPLFKTVMDFVKELGCLSFEIIRHRWVELYEDRNRAMALYRSLLIELCGDKVPNEILCEYFDLYNKTPRAIEIMIDKAIQNSNRDYSISLSKFIVYSKLFRNEEIKEIIASFLFKSTETEDDLKNRINRFRFSMHLFLVYLKCLIKGSKGGSKYV